MKRNDSIPLVGAYHLVVYERDKDGNEKIIRDDIKNNLLVTVGKDTMLKYLATVTGGARVDKIGVGNSTTVAAAGNTGLIGSSTLIKTISTVDRVYVRPTLYISVEFGYTEANFLWNELALLDSNSVLIARQVDESPLNKTSSKRAIVEWQLTI